MCCRDIRLSVKINFRNKLEALAWIATVWPAEGELGLPFIPDKPILARYWDTGPGTLPYDATSPLEVEWLWQCIYIEPDGRCGNYEHRPNLCRTFYPGWDKPCIMYHEFSSCCGNKQQGSWPLPEPEKG